MTEDNRRKQRLENLISCFDENTIQRIKDFKILLVGAGGIGCELLKNLVLCGFTKIDVIDLDTIDLSNLNRQFLFSRRDIGLSKSKCAKRSVLEFVTDEERNSIEINAYEANVKEERFGIKYVENFDVVLNALDNISARQHVNRICIASNIPLLDSGTMGYLGQTSIIFKSQTACYDCELKTDAKKKSYAICTIRNTPDKPVHCVVWAKEVLKLVFGNRNESMLAELIEESSNSVEDMKPEGNEPGIETDDLNMQRESEIKARSLIMKASKLPILKENDPFFHENTVEKTESYLKLRLFCKQLFDALFHEEINLKLKLRNGYKGAKYKPTPFKYDDIADISEISFKVDNQKTLSKHENCAVFTKTIISIVKNRYSDVGKIVFEKDDEDIMNLVAALSNLRASVFGIENKSGFEMKGIAGNIIHAIATTNAIVAGLQTLEVLKLVRNKVKNDPILCGCKATWVSKEPTSSGCLLQPEKKLSIPNPNCYTCGTAQLKVYLNTRSFTLETLIQIILKKRLGINCPSVVIGVSEIYLEGEGLDEEEILFFKKNLQKCLVDCPPDGIKDGTILNVEDYTQNIAFQLLVHHVEDDKIDENVYPEKFMMLDTEQAPPINNSVSNKKENGKLSVNGLEIISDQNHSSSLNKNGSSRKKLKI